MGATEVTNAQYEQFDPDHKKLRGRDGVSKADDEPVTFVTWQQAVAFCEWLSKKEGKPYRLPTEAEWEYACRAGTATPFHTGDTLTAEQANIGLTADGKPQPTTVPVGSYKPNAWGLYDMHGNVRSGASTGTGRTTRREQTDPVGRADGYARVARGWCFHRPGAGPRADEVLAQRQPLRVPARGRQPLHRLPRRPGRDAGDEAAAGRPRRRTRRT